MPAAARVHVVPHTHWDREWYLPFAVYRRRLVALMDSLLLALADEPGLCFHLDGQMALVDDYLELRPERRAVLEAAGAEGRVSLGPWYTLPDEHLVSGECLLRNLELGLSTARRFGEPLLVGYLPDQFGHSAQMPQLLRHAGIGTAVLWRGVPAELASRAFRWEGLDGRAVDAVHLGRGYGHGRELPLEDPAALAQRLDRELEDQRQVNPDGPWLVMAGDDHLEVPRGLAAAVQKLDPARGVVVAGLGDHVAVAPVAAATWRGELHSAARAFTLKGTLSSRLGLKQRQAALERRVERYLEPAWALRGRAWPERELAYIWRQLILNTAHDTVCGCSIDEVHEEQARRLERAESLASLLWERLEPGPGRFNPSPFARRGIPGLGVAVGSPQPVRPVAVDRLGLSLEAAADRGDEYTHQAVEGEEPVQVPLAAEVALGPDLSVTAAAEEREGEPFIRLSLAIENSRHDHRLRLLVPGAGAGSAWAGVAFGAVERAYRPPGSEPGREYDLRTDPARDWVFAGGAGVLLAGPFEYELTPSGLAVTLLRCVGFLSRADLAYRPGHAGPGLATPAAQVPGRHRLELGLIRTAAGWLAAGLPRWAEVFALPLVPGPAGLGAGPAWEDPATMLSCLRLKEGRLQLRTYSLEDFRITETWPGEGDLRIPQAEPRLPYL